MSKQNKLESKRDRKIERQNRKMNARLRFNILGPFQGGFNLLVSKLVRKDPLEKYEGRLRHLTLRQVNSEWVTNTRYERIWKGRADRAQSPDLQDAALYKASIHASFAMVAKEELKRRTSPGKQNV